VELQRKQIVELLRKRTLDSEKLSIKTSQEKPPQAKPEGPPDVTIMYTNFQGETKAFSAWRSTIKVVNNHLSACVAPSGQRIALAIDRIGNLEELGDLPLSQPEVDIPEATESAPDPHGESTSVEEISRPMSPEKPVPKVEGGWRYIPIVSYSFSRGQVKAQQVGTRLRPDFETSIEFIYINHRGEPRVFKGNRFTLRDKGLFYSLVVEPKNRRIALKKERIRNLDKHSPIPSRAEIRQMIKTLRRGTTNAQYEALQKQYPDWCPALPTPKEARVLTYHATRGSTSPLFEQIKAKFTSPTEEEDITPEIAEETIVTQPESQPVPVPEPEPEPEPATMNVVITGCGMSTYDAQKILQELKPDLRFYDLYKLLRDFPQVAFENLPPQEAQSIKARLEAAGCTVELK
jgi:ribosomal protein L7/L12